MNIRFLTENKEYFPEYAGLIKKDKSDLFYFLINSEGIGFLGDTTTQTIVVDDISIVLQNYKFEARLVDGQDFFGIENESNYAVVEVFYE